MGPSWARYVGSSLIAVQPAPARETAYSAAELAPIMDKVV